MPAKKTASQKRKSEKTNKETPQVEILPSMASEHLDSYQLALTKVNVVTMAKGGSPQGTISMQRAEHDGRWHELLRQDQGTRDQILKLKEKENQVLDLIGDKVAGNLIETIDSAVEQGILEAPEEV